ncbi:hypothetical protein [Mycolicibacterium hodleri]|uniref:Uncharacterized protein n=1 Tax=Mycolicibacterium hodleri TaxID=49897 RepID=A0A502EDJ3_9MYCO|nr:hypothetical protein [Mycolicibacterium hodleri]TPG35042.1 hypothetical protein EAH80_09640 [Mycolicibacterium hodleri]
MTEPHTTPSADLLPPSQHTSVPHLQVDLAVVGCGKGGKTSPHETARVVAAAQASGRTWFGTSVWHGELVMRISVSSWRTTGTDVDDLLDLMRALRRRH